GKVWPGNPVDAARILEVPAGTPAIRSVVAPQPEGLPEFGRPEEYGGGGPQTQLPKNLFPRPAEGSSVSPAQVGDAVRIGERAESWYTRMQRYPGGERAAELTEQAEVIERSSELGEQAHTAETVATLYDRLAGGEGEGEGESGPVVETVNPAYA